MTFTYRQTLLWITLSFIASVILLLLFAGGVCSLFGLSVALNLYLSWHYYGHDRMLASLGLLHPAEDKRS